MKRSLPEMLDDEMKRRPSLDVDNETGFGALSTERGCLPLEALDVQARLDGLIARVMVTQTFVNNHDVALEATYIFPLPDRAAVTCFRLEVAGRIVEGELKERGAARQEYEQAIQKGHRAAITEEERPGVFTMRVGNLPPRERATVRLTLSGPLPYSDGEATFRFPLVVAPRYIPGTPLPGAAVGDGTTPDTDAVPDASRISPPVLLPGFPNPVRLGLSVEVPLSSLQPSDFRSSLHTVLESEDNDTKLFRLQPGERLDRDFLLRFRIGQDRLVTSLSLQPDRDGPEGTFLLTLVPPVEKTGQGTGRDVVFVLDRSGSMSGWKIVAARRALARMVDTLTEHDRFTVFAFDDRIETPPEFGGNHLVPATDRMRFRAVEFLAKLDARGGTEMAEPLNRAVNELFREKAPGRKLILVLVTDGQVGNEDQILKHLGQRVKGIRSFTLGIDRAVNAAFLRRLSDLGGGHCELVESEDRLDEVMDSIHRHIGTPVLTGLRLEPAGLRFLPESVVPGRLPDLFTGTPLVVSGRYRGDADGAIALQARDAAGQPWSAEVRGRRVDHPALTAVWARGRLREMEDRYVIGAGDRSALEREIVATSLRFGMLCRFTAFVAVDRSEVANPGGQVHGVVQPVEQPEGWVEASHTTPSPDSDVIVKGSFTGVTRVFRAMPLRAKSRKQVQSPSPAPPPSAHYELAEPLRTGAESETESVDSLLQSFSDSEHDVLDRADETTVEMFDATRLPTPARQLALEVWQTLQSSAQLDANARHAVLGKIAARMKELYQALVAARLHHPAVKDLGEILQRLHGLLAASNPQKAAIHKVWPQIENCLQRLLALSETPKSPRRDGFWK
jgi:Ca-activated chloride channel family protein